MKKNASNKQTRNRSGADSVGQRSGAAAVCVRSCSALVCLRGDIQRIQRKTEHSNSAESVSGANRIIEPHPKP